MRSRTTRWGWALFGTGLAALIVMAILWAVGVWGPADRDDRSCDRDGRQRGDCPRGDSHSDGGVPGAWGMGTIESEGMSMDMDRHFIVQMIPHHEDAVEMAQLALTKATHPELKTLAQAIITTQNQEIEQMRDWYQDWYGGEVPEVVTTSASPESGGGMMGGGMMMGEVDLQDLENAADFDKVFIEQMVPHHQMGVMMARMISGSTERPELESLAQAIITSQTQEIEQMQAWYEAWYR